MMKTKTSPIKSTSSTNTLTVKQRCDSGQRCKKDTRCNKKTGYCEKTELKTRKASVKIQQNVVHLHYLEQKEKKFKIRFDACK